MTVRKGIPRLGKHRKEPDFGTKCPEVAGSVPTPEYAAIVGAPAKPHGFVGRGAAAERVSFRHLAEANDTQLAATRHAPRSFGTTCPEVTSGQSVQKSGSWRCFPSRGILFSDGHSVFKVLSIDELP